MLKKRLLALYFIFAIVPVVVIIFFLLAVHNRNVSAIEDVLLSYAVEQTSRNLSERIRRYKYIMAHVATDRELRSLIVAFRELSSTDVRGRAVLFNQISETLANYMRRDGAIASISLVTYELDLIMAQRTGQDWEFFERMGDKQFLQALLERVSRQGGITIAEAVSLSGADEEIYQFIYFIYPSKNHITHHSNGVFVMEIYSDVFNQVMHANPNPTDFEGYISPYSYIADNYGTIVSSHESIHVGRNMSDIDVFNRLIVKSAPIVRSGLSVYLVFERGSMEVFTEDFRNVVLVFVLATMFIFSILMLFFIDKLTEEHLRIVKTQQLRAELNAIEAQINPHFIYNVLDRINWIAIDNGQDKISRMLNGLAGLLRYSINNIDMLVPLHEEIEWMRKYIFIQSERFGQEIIFNYHSEDGAWKFNLHKMLLQPLVENSILHGFQEHEGRAEISLNIHVHDDSWLEIILRDNGCGVDKQGLEKIRSLIETRDKDMSNHIGISNVSARLWYYYGDEASMDVSSCVGEGTEVRLFIPGR